MSRQFFPLQAVPNPQTLELFAAPGRYHEVILSFSSAPAAGTALIEYRPLGALAAVPLVHAGPAQLSSGRVAVRVDGPLQDLRVTFSGLVGGADPVLWVDTQAQPAGLFAGDAAMAVQFYPELNIKRGLQFYVRAVWPKADPIPGGETRRLWFSTGPSPVLVKSRVAEYDGEELRIDIFGGPTGVTGGGVITPRNYNRINPVAAVSQAKKNVTTVSDGTLFDPDDPEYFFGASNAPQRTPGAILQGRERVLPAFAEFIVAITNTGQGPARFSYFLDYFQGGTDIPL